MIKAVLFDLDGTFADTAPDLCYALNLMREARKLAPVPLEATRPVTSLGARGLLGVGFNITPDDPAYLSLREEFLTLYEQNLCRHTLLFPGISELIDALESRGLRWGIVTNKTTNLTWAVVKALGLDQRAACVVCGDTTPHLKPHPASLLHAAAELGLRPADCTYLGDDLRDIQAARSAGMRAVAVEWGYGQGLHGWNADAVIAHPQDLIEWL
jgi:2-phosphoglycolate phosphatase